MRIYKGMIYKMGFEEEFLNGIDLNAFHLFKATGFWTRQGREFLSYQLCNEKGEHLQEFSHLQFSRTRENMFFLESVN